MQHRLRPDFQLLSSLCHHDISVQVAGRTFGVPAQLAERIAMYTDNATKQLQLDRQCNAYKQQRRLRTQHLEQHSQKVDHVLLNKTAILLPASMLEGTHIKMVSVRHPATPLKMLCLTSETIAIVLLYTLFSGLHGLHIYTPLHDSNIHNFCATNDLLSPACKPSVECASQKILQ